MYFPHDISHDSFKDAYCLARESFGKDFPVTVFVLLFLLADTLVVQTALT